MVQDNLCCECTLLPECSCIFVYCPRVFLLLTCFCVWLTCACSCRLPPAAGVCCALPGLHGGSLWRQPGGDLWGHEAGAGRPSHTQHLQDHRVAPHGHQQQPQVRFITQVWKPGLRTKAWFRPGVHIRLERGHHNRKCFLWPLVIGSHFPTLYVNQYQCQLCSRRENYVVFSSTMKYGHWEALKIDQIMYQMFGEVILKYYHNLAMLFY